MITEASPLTFPENASLEEENFVLNRDGSRQRRLGMDFENGNSFTSVDYTEGSNGNIEHFLWKNAGSVQDTDISVIKVSNKFFFYDNNSDTVSSSPLNGGNSVTIEGLDPTGSGNPVIYNYAFINGKMFIVSGLQVVTVLDYDADTDSVISGTSTSGNTKSISIRDTFGIFDNRPINERPFLLTMDNREVHLYNLANQGWHDNQRVAATTVPRSDVDTIAWTWTTFNTTSGNTGISLLPSNSDTLESGEYSGGVPQLFGLYYPQELLNETYGSRHAPKGSIIFDNMFERGTKRAEIVSGRSGLIGTAFSPISEIANAVLPSPHSTEATNGGLSNITSYNGRLIYSVFENGRTNSDDSSPSFGNMIFYSQATDGSSGLTKCHTDIDPTSSEDFSLLDTDGGYITLSGTGTINALEVLGSSLFVFADNGVWQINGGSSLFTPSNININKVTNVGNINSKGVVISDNVLFYLADNGIYQVSLSEVDPSLPAAVVSVTESTIQGLYNGFTSEMKQKAVSSFDRFANQVKWLFSVEGAPDSSYYDTEVILDLTLGSFSINKIKTVLPLLGNSPYIIEYLERPSLVLTDTSKQITHEGDNVIVGVGNNVGITFRSIASSVFTSNKYWTITKTSPTTVELSVAEYKDLEFRDWGAIANTSSGFGEDAHAFLLTGYLTGGDSSVNKRVTYITTHFRRTERLLSAVTDGFEPDNPSSCTLTGQWEWTNSANAGRWSTPREVYRLPRTFIPDTGSFDFGHEVVTTKNKLRGKGKALSLLFETSPLKDCHLYGWSYELDVETSV